MNWIKPIIFILNFYSGWNLCRYFSFSGAIALKCFDISGEYWQAGGVRPRVSAIVRMYEATLPQHRPISCMFVSFIVLVNSAISLREHCQAIKLSGKANSPDWNESERCESCHSVQTRIIKILCLFILSSYTDHFYRLQMKLQENSVFTGVCQSFCPQGGGGR